MAADLPTENMCSLGLRLQYGSFRYFTGGDLPGAADPGLPALHSVEPAIGGVVGPVDAHVVNQHGSMGEESDAFIKALQSNILIVPSWRGVGGTLPPRLFPGGGKGRSDVRNTGKTTPTMRITGWRSRAFTSSEGLA
jgi:hypothetical protein